MSTAAAVTKMATATSLAATQSNSTLPLHMYIRPLTIEDARDATELEAKGFPENERASLESIKYRLTVCPELCSGLFIRNFNKNDNITIESEKLIGHVLSTKIPKNKSSSSSKSKKTSSSSNNTFITLKSMEIGSHSESSNVIGLHSLVISQEYQKKNLATLLLTDYIQKLSNQEVGNKLVLIAHEYLVPFYERIGFKLDGENTEVAKKESFSKTKWMNMSRELLKEDYDA